MIRGLQGSSLDIRQLEKSNKGDECLLSRLDPLTQSARSTSLRDNSAPSGIGSKFSWSSK